MNILEATNIHKSYGNKFNRQEVFKRRRHYDYERRICRNYGRFRIRQDDSSERAFLH